MQIFVDMAKTLAVFCLLEQMILNLLPSSIYERYVKFYLGLLLLILLLPAGAADISPDGQLTAGYLPVRMNGRSRRRYGRQNGNCQRTGRKDKEKYWPPGKTSC